MILVVGKCAHFYPEVRALFVKSAWTFGSLRKRGGDQLLHHATSTMGFALNALGLLHSQLSKIDAPKGLGDIPRAGGESAKRKP